MKPSDEFDINLRYSKKDTNVFFNLLALECQKSKKFECFFKVLMKFSLKAKVWNAFRNGSINYFEMVDTFQFEINFAISKSTWNFNIK